MKIAEADILLVPGRSKTLSDHWQHRWQGRMVNAEWVPTATWRAPTLEQRTDELLQSILMATRPVVIVAHSLGVLTTIFTAQSLVDTKVRGALFVAPPHVEKTGSKTWSNDFTDVPRDPLPFPSLLIASSNDPYCEQETAAGYAASWGSEFHDAGESGHIETASGHGPWPEGLMMFTRLMQRIKA